MDFWKDITGCVFSNKSAWMLLFVNSLILNITFSNIYQNNFNNLFTVDKEKLNDTKMLNSNWPFNFYIECVSTLLTDTVTKDIINV